MSYTIIYKVPEAGPIEVAGEFQNAWLGAMHVWDSMADRYVGQAFHAYKQDTWNLCANEEVPLPYRIALMTTFDRVMVKRQHIPRVIEAFAAFAQKFGAGNLIEQARCLRKLADDEACYAVCWNQTSVTAAWMIYELDRDDYRPYDLSRDSGHWFMFKDDEVPQLRQE